MEMVEEHAYASYNKFLTEAESDLKAQPAPEIAQRYYRDGDLYLFDEFQTAQVPASRRPKIDNLYDVFVAIRDDEMEHVKTMVACQQPVLDRACLSPHDTADLAGSAAIAVPPLDTVTDRPQVGAS